MKKLFRQAMPFVLILIGLSLASCKSDNQGVLLRYNPPLGEPITFVTTMNQSMDLFGQQMTTNMNMTMVMTATEKTDSLITTQARLDEITLTSDVMGQAISFDSKHMEDADPELASSFKDLLGKTFEIVNDIYGKAVSMPEDFPNKDQGFMAIYPKEMIHEGSEWTVEADNEINDMKMHTVMTYTVKKITKEKTEIELVGKIKSEMAKGEITGNMMINNQTGMPKTCELNMPLKVSGATINQTVTMTTE